jgi:SAM-dependent methyltransferase
LETSDKIELEPIASCMLCGGMNYETIYSGLTDRWYSAPGTWRIQACSTCGLVALNPRPTAATVGTAYASYYTHGLAEDEALASQEPRGSARLLAPLQRRRRELEDMYLSERPPGHLLDVGCGDGMRLRQMRERGWQVTGVETDAQAAQMARKRHGISVFNGEVTSAGFPADHFDAITLSHVIEHVYRPIELLAECRRILKPGGRLVMVTPNVQSLGRFWFGPDWREWDPPRHCYLYAPDTMRTLATKGGFRRAEIHTTGVRANFIAAGSLQIRATGRYRPDAPIRLFDRIFSTLFLAAETGWSFLAPGRGEELVMKAEKDLSESSFMG